MDYIREKVPMTELLAGLAEECCELAQAALKLRRCLDGTNPTPADPDKQYEAMVEEAGDVDLYLDTICIDREIMGAYKREKKERWKKRLKELGEF